MVLTELKILAEKIYSDKSTQLDLYDSDLSEVYADLQQAFDAWFNPSSGETLKEWVHQKEFVNQYRVSRNLLIEAVENYQQNFWFKNSDIDLIFVDMLLFAETLATQQMLIEKGEKKVAGVIFWLALICSWFIHPMLLILFLAYLAIRFAIKMYIVVNLTKVAETMKIAYSSLKYKDWKIIIDDIHHSRRHGAVWDDVVYELLKRNG